MAIILIPIGEILSTMDLDILHSDILSGIRDHTTARITHHTGITIIPGIPGTVVDTMVDIMGVITVGLIITMVIVHTTTTIHLIHYTRKIQSIILHRSKEGDPTVHSPEIMLVHHLQDLQQ